MDSKVKRAKLPLFRFPFFSNRNRSHKRWNQQKNYSHQSRNKHKNTFQIRIISHLNFCVNIRNIIWRFCEVSLVIYNNGWCIANYHIRKIRFWSIGDKLYRSRAVMIQVIRKIRFEIIISLTIPFLNSGSISFSDLRLS